MPESADRVTAPASVAQVAMGAGGRATTLVAVVAMSVVRTDARAPAFAAPGALAAVRAHGRAPAIATGLALTFVGTFVALASRFTGDAPLASMAVAVDLELRFDSAALTLCTYKELSALRVVGSHYGSTGMNTGLLYTLGFLFFN